MRFFCSIQILTMAVFLVPSMSLASVQEAGSGLKREGPVNQSEALRAISTPPPTYPDEAALERIEGKVTLRIVVDAKGNVSEARALSGPAELIPAAIAAASKWKFEPPTHPPVTKSADISFGFLKECSGPVSDSGEILGGASLLDENGKLVAVVDGDRYAVPPYPDSERKAGVAGKMV